MEKGINLSLTKSLAEFDALLDMAIEEVISKKLSVAQELDEANLCKFQVGKYVQIENEDEEEDGDETPIFWIGYGWEENEKRESCLWMEFDAKTCPAKYWEKVYKLAGTSGKYYRKVDSEFAQVYMNNWIHFFLKDEYLGQFYDENADINSQKKILTGFINEVLEKL